MMSATSKPELASAAKACADAMPRLLQMRDQESVEEARMFHAIRTSLGQPVQKAIGTRTPGVARDSLPAVSAAPPLEEVGQ